MRVAHLVSNFKWTERSEPAADLAVAQQAAGAEVFFLCGRNRLRPEDSIEVRAARKGLDVHRLDFPKHFRLTTVSRDVRALRRFVAERRVDVLHSHLPNAHLLSVIACRGREPRPRIVRSSYGPDGPYPTFRFRRLCLSSTDGLLVAGEAARAVVRERFRLPPERVACLEPGIDLARFSNPEVQADRPGFGLAEDDFVVGMVTAIGPRRRLDIVLDAVRRLAPDHPRLRLMIVGRGKIEAMIEEPARTMGIRDRIVLPGYCRDDRLVAAYRAMDVFAYPVPGTDPSARAIREAMAAGTAVLAGRTGFLPELLEDGTCGRLCDVDGTAFADGIRSLTDDTERVRLARAGSEAARRRFDPRKQAEASLRFYEALRRTGT